MKTDLPDFDVLLEMAEKRPEQLESLRSELIESVISSADEACQRRLRGLQFRIDATRRASGTPMAACIRISEMMHESLHSLQACLNEPWAYTSAQQAQRSGGLSDPTPSCETVVSMDRYRTERQPASAKALF